VPPHGEHLVAERIERKVGEDDHGHGGVALHAYCTHGRKGLFLIRAGVSPGAVEKVRGFIGG
jgi:hypothetical protein